MSLLVRLRSRAQVGLDLGEAFRELRLSLLVGEVWHDDAVFAVRPVNRGGYGVVVGQLQCVDHAKNFIKVAAGGGRVGDRQSDLFVRIDNEHGTHGELFGGVRVDHVVRSGDGAIRIGDDREVDRGILSFVDVLDPSMMVFNRIDTDGDRLDTSLVELRFQLGRVAKLGGANRGVVGRVGEKYRPAITDPVVKIDVSFSCFRLKIRSLVA